jgi:hypothetical protein
MVINNIKGFVRRRLRQEPIHKVIRKLRKRKINLKDLDALEIFGYTGEYHTRFYAPFVRKLEVWEIDQKYKESLRRNLPLAEIKITDSFKEIKQTGMKYGLIVVDNPMSTFGDYCEHFNLFPDIFRIVGEQAVLILNVIPKITLRDRENRPDLFDDKQLELRSSFYRTQQPDHISFEDMITRYKDLYFENGYILDWFFFQRRTSVYYLVCRIFRSVNQLN